jgi:tRNA A37 threonylcarbamoyltransferase TsaD
MKTLAIETSCDDTSLAIVHEENGSFFVDKIVAYSQINDHQKY